MLKKFSKSRTNAKSWIVGIICFFSTLCGWADPTLLSLSGEKIPFASLRGKWVLINYWASWCQSCLDEIPELNRFYKENQQNLYLFAVNFDRLPPAIQEKLVKQYNIRYPALKKDPAPTLHLGDITAVPATFVFNPQGDLVDTLYGQQTRHSLQQLARTIKYQAN